jgi:uncharacterized delta-60 repeat protein
LTFPNLAINSTVQQAAVAQDGKILILGGFTQVAGQVRTNLARLLPNGALDSTFAPNPGGDMSYLTSMALQADGKLLVAGLFDQIAGQPCVSLGRLNTNGTLDATFLHELPGSFVSIGNIALQADGKILLRGGLNLARLLPNGQLDSTFNVWMNTDGYASWIGLSPAGKLVLSGNFASVNGFPRAGFCQLAIGEAQSSVATDASTITWLRNGTLPDVSRTEFAYSTNGTNWIGLGTGTHITDGWRVNATMPAGSLIRARGLVDGSGNPWWLEQRVDADLRLFLFGPNSPFGFGVRVVPAQSVVIEASTNLVNWDAIYTNPSPTTNVLIFSDPDSGQHPRRFYRVHSP